MRCVLHIGTEKTGTTLLQEWLYRNREALHRQGVHLSTGLGNKNNFYISEFFQSEIDDWARGAGLFTLADKAHFFRNFEVAISQEFRRAAARYDVLLITSEFLHSRLSRRGDIARLADFLSGFCTKIDVICYFREQSSMATSRYTTELLRDCTLELDDFLREDARPANYYYDFKAIADNWSAVFGAASCHFRIYDRERFIGRDIRTDFLAGLGSGVDPEALDYSEVPCNPALKRLQAEAMLAVNRAIPYFMPGTHEVDARNLRLKRQLLCLEALRKGVLRSPSAGDIAARFVAINEALFDCHFDGAYLFAAVENEDQTGIDPCDAGLVRETVERLVATGP